MRRLFALTDFDQYSKWSYIGSDLGFQQLRGVELVPSKGLSRACLSNQIKEAASRQFVLDHFHDQPTFLFETLYRYQQQGAVVLNRSTWCESVLQRFPPELLDDGDLLDGHFSIPDGTLQSRLKRVGDLGLASALLILSSPLILLTALLIKASDRGPAFYSQVRTGLGGKPYRIWKLRTMRKDAEHQGVQWSTRSDPRVTKLGSILRRTRIDELPQLWCVITGTMNLIGPRPERPEFDQFLSQKIPYYELRHLIRPGLSGWAQVNYPYGASVDDSMNKLSYDLFYLKNFLSYSTY